MLQRITRGIIWLGILATAIVALWALIGLTAYEYWGFDLDHYLGVENASKLVWEYFFIPGYWVMFLWLFALLVKTRAWGILQKR